MDRLGQVGFGDGLGSFQIGNCPSDAPNLIVGASAQSQFIHGLFHEQQAGVIEGAVLLELFGIEAGVGRAIGMAIELFGAGIGDGVADGGAAGAGGFAGEIAVGDRGDFDVKVDAIEEGAGEFFEVFIAGAGVGGVVALGGWVRCHFAILR